MEKLLRAGEGWLGDHPHHRLIVSRYLKNRRNLTRLALDSLIGEESFGSLNDIQSGAMGAEVPLSDLREFAAQENKDSPPLITQAAQVSSENPEIRPAFKAAAKEFIHQIGVF